MFVTQSSGVINKLNITSKLINIFIKYIAYEHQTTWRQNSGQTSER